MCQGQRKPLPGGIGFHAVNPQAQAWMRRSVANRNAQVVCDDVEQTVKQMRLFQKPPNSSTTVSSTTSSPVPRCYHRNDIEVGKLLGQGAFCQVHEVTRIYRSQESSQQQPHEKDEEVLPLVMKHLRKDIVMKSTHVYQQAAADLVIESKILACLSHPNIIRIRGWATHGAHGYCKGMDGDGFFMILDKLDETLSQRLDSWRQQAKKQPLLHRHGCNHPLWQPQQQEQQRMMVKKLGYAKQIVDALEYLHSHDMVFRDLKPDNIGIQGNVVQLFDFGLCRELPESRPDTNRVFAMSGVGTRRYLAPEVILGKAYNQKVDVYSWSMVLHEMLSLQKPFDLYGHQMHMEWVVKGGERPKLASEWPSSLQQLLQQAWADEPQHRPCMKQVQETLQHIMSTMEGLSPDASMNVIRELLGLFGLHQSDFDLWATPKLKSERTERTSVMSGSLSLSTC